MGFTKYFYTFLVLIILGIIASWFFIVQGRVYLASWKLQQDFKDTVGLAKNPEHVEECDIEDKEKLFDEDYLPPVLGYRLRFTDNQSYLIEAVCRRSYLGPFEVKSDRLWHQVRKLAGTGIMVNLSDANKQLDASVILGLGKRYQGVGYRQGKLDSWVISDPSVFIAGVNAAPTSCEGNGQQCCDATTQVGVGDRADNVLTCQNNCYNSCLSRPTITIFNTEPFLNIQTRTLQLSSATGTEVKFGYRLNDSDGTIQNVTLDFGDGQQAQRNSNYDIIPHIYTCKTSPCIYTATLTATDNDGLELAQSRLQQIIIEVR